MKKIITAICLLISAVAAHSSTRTLSIVNNTQAQLSFTLNYEGDNSYLDCTLDYTDKLMIYPMSSGKVYVTYNEYCYIQRWDGGGKNIKSSISWTGTEIKGTPLRYPIYIGIASEVAPPWDGGMIYDPNVLPYSYSVINAFQINGKDDGLTFLNDRQTITINYNK